MVRHASDEAKSNSTLQKRWCFLWALVAGTVAIATMGLSGVSEKLGMALYDVQMRALVKTERQTSAQSETLRKIRGTSILSSQGAAAHPAKATPIALVSIDQSSLDWAQRELGLGWPWPRELYGIMASYMRGAKVQAYDILFTEPSTFGPEDDARCAKAMTDAGNVVLATLANKRPVFDISGVPYGHVSALVDADGVCRRYQVWLEQNDGHLPSLGLAAIEAAGWSSAAADQQQVLLRYENSANFERYTAAQILAAALHAGGAGGNTGTDGKKGVGIDFHDKVVVVGLTAPGLLDRQATPIDPALPGMEVHATFVADALDSSFMRRSSLWIEIVAALAAAAFFAFLPMLRRKAWAAVVGIAAVCLPFAASFLLFKLLVFYNPVSALAGELFAFIVALALGYQTEGRQKAYLRRAFAQYLSPAVISSLVEHPETLSLGGEEKIITTLFSDMAGFTSVSEKLNPEELARFMNEYLGIISEEVLAQGGTLDKYVGDAVVAFWNAPLDEPDHALRALAAAARIQESLMGHARDFEGRFGIAPRTRVGVATGRAVVGNLGTSRRFAYTAVGDSVNVASRLEAANKSVGTSILTMRDTVAAALGTEGMSGPELRKKLAGGETLLLRRLGSALVEGKTQPVELWSVALSGSEDERLSEKVVSWTEVRRFSK